MDKVIFGVIGGLIFGYIVGFFVLKSDRNRRNARLLIRAQEATRYDQLVSVLNQAPANSQAGKLAREKVEVLVLEMAQNATTIFQLKGILWMCHRDSQAEKLARRKLETLRKKEYAPPSRNTLLNKCNQEEFERMIDKIP